MHPDRRILVLGGGPAGVAAAPTAARMGAQAILIDSGRLGGISTNSGALPARVLAHAARLKRDSGQLGVYGLRANEAGLDWPAALQRLSNVVEALHARKEIAEDEAALPASSDGSKGHAYRARTIGFMTLRTASHRRGSTCRQRA